MRLSEFIDLMSFRYKIEKWNSKKEIWEEMERTLSYYNAKCYINNLEKNNMKGIYRIVKKIRVDII